MPPFLFLPHEEAYKAHFRDTLVRGRITTFHSVSVKFKYERFSHAFFESTRRDQNMDLFSPIRAKRMGWIKPASENQSRIGIKDGQESAKDTKLRVPSRFSTGVLPQSCNIISSKTAWQRVSSPEMNQTGEYERSGTSLAGKPTTVESIWELKMAADLLRWFSDRKTSIDPLPLGNGLTMHL